MASRLPVTKVVIEPGEKFERLEVICRVEDHITKRGQRYSNYLCKCSCGAIKEIRGYSLTKHTTKSCGCLNRDIVRGIGKKYGGSIKHGHASASKWTSEYQSWHDLKSRCINPNRKQYKDYGGRGIAVYKQWLGVDGFQTFLDYMGPKPTPQHTIDRINVNGNYEPGNVRWANRSEQARNKRNSVTYRKAPSNENIACMPSSV